MIEEFQTLLGLSPIFAAGGDAELELLLVVLLSIEFAALEDDAVQLVAQKMVVFHPIVIGAIYQQIILLRKERKGEDQFAVAGFLQFVERSLLIFRQIAVAADNGQRPDWTILRTIMEKDVRGECLGTDGELDAYIDILPAG
jgi:hypothetical protein